MAKLPHDKPVNRTRTRVLSATLSLFSSKGYFNTSVHDIAHESEVSIGSIYHHFEGKEGLASALHNSLLDRMSAEFDQIRKTYSSAHDRCRATIALLFEITESEPEVMEFMLYAKHREFLPDESPVCSSKPFEQMREMVSEGMVSNEIRSMDILVASTCLYGACIRMITSRLDGLVPDKLPAYIDDIWQCSWRAVSK